MNPPRGIYYEAARNRFRVRLYKGARVVHLSYHSTLKEAEAALAVARESVRHVQNDDTGNRDLTSLHGQLAALMT